MLEVPPLEPFKGVEMGNFRRAGVQRGQRIVMFLLIFLVSASLFFVMVSAGLDQLVYYSVNENLVYRDEDDRSINLIPKLTVEIGFSVSCIAGQCYCRKDVGIPALLKTPQQIREAVVMENHMMDAYSVIREYFEVGFNFAVACGSDTHSSGPRNVSNLVIASHVILIAILSVMLVAGGVLYRQLSDPDTLYHRVSRKHLVCYPGVSRSHVEALADNLTQEARVSCVTMQVLLITGALSFSFGLCALCGCLTVFWRPGCSNGFCDAFQAEMSKIAKELNTKAVGTTCRYGKTVYLSIVFFCCVTVLFCLIIGFWTHVWLDDKRRKVNEAILYLKELKHSLPQFNAETDEMRLGSFDDPASIMMWIAQDHKAEDQRRGVSLMPPAEESKKPAPLDIRHLPPVELSGVSESMEHSVSEKESRLRVNCERPQQSEPPEVVSAALPLSMLSLITQEADQRKRLEYQGSRRLLHLVHRAEAVLRMPPRSTTSFLDPCPNADSVGHNDPNELPPAQKGRPRGRRRGKKISE